MQDRVTYEYAVIRLVPKVEREEFINIGVMLFSRRKKYIGIKYEINEKRIHAFAEKVDVPMIAEYLDAWKQVCIGNPSGGSIGKLELPSRFRWLAASRSTIIQTSKTHTGICHDPEKVLEDLFVRYVS